MTAITCVVMLLSSGCRHHRVYPGDVSDSTFVAVMAELRHAVQPGGAETTRDSAGRAAIRDSILAKYHVTAAALESTASHAANDPPRASELFRAIDRKVESIRPAAPAPHPVIAVPPAAAANSAAALAKPGTGAAAHGAGPDAPPEKNPASSIGVLRKPLVTPRHPPPSP